MRRNSPALRSVPPPTPADTPPDVSPEAPGGPPLLAADLLARLERIERDVYTGGANRRIGIEEIARLLRCAPGTVREWTKSAEKVERYRLDILLVVLPNGDIYSTPRLRAQWEDAIRLQWQRVLYGEGRRPGERLVGEARR